MGGLPDPRERDGDRNGRGIEWGVKQAAETLLSLDVVVFCSEASTCVTNFSPSTFSQDGNCFFGNVLGSILFFPPFPFSFFELPLTGLLCYLSYKRLSHVARANV